MKSLDPGHYYSLEIIDASNGGETIRFVKRIGERYPGNEPPGYPGTTIQEVLRVLIDRMKYVDGQRPHFRNSVALWNLRSALIELEFRAHAERGIDSRDERLDPLTAAEHRNNIPGVPGKQIEDLAACFQCGHVCCTLHGPLGLSG